MWQSKEELLNLTIELVNQKSISSSKDEAKIAEYIYNKLKELEYYKTNPNYLYLEPINDDYGRYLVCALMTSNKPTDKTIITIAHMDTADIENAGSLKDYILHPYEYSEKLKQNIHLLDEESKKDLLSDNYLFGRGIMDMKMGLAMQMSFLEYYSNMKDFEGNLLFLALPDEESNSKGAISAIPFINSLIETHNLNPIAVLNSEPDFGMNPGDDNKYIYLGTCGKLLLGFYIIGSEVHVGESLSGLNPNLIGAELISKLDLNIDLCEKVNNEVTMPPTCLKYEDTKKAYNIQMPPSSVMYYNLQTLNSNPKQIINKLKQICNETTSTIIEKIEEANRKYCSLSNCSIKNNSTNIKVFTIDELYKKMITEYGDDIKQSLNEKIKIWTEDSSLDEREITIKIVEYICTYAKGEGPMIIIFFAPPYYPHIGIDENNNKHKRIISIVEDVIYNAKEQYNENIYIQRYFKGLSDLSYFALQDGDDVINYLKPNMPLIGYKYDIPFDEIKKLNLPVLNYGPHGKDPHKFTERILVDYSFDITPKIAKDLIERLFDL